MPSGVMVTRGKSLRVLAEPVRVAAVANEAGGLDVAEDGVASHPTGLSLSGSGTDAFEDGVDQVGVHSGASFFFGAAAIAASATACQTLFVLLLNFSHGVSGCDEAARQDS